MAMFGCPHFSIRQIQDIAGVCEGKRFAVDVWILVSSLTRELARRMGLLIVLPPMKKVIGFPEEANVIAGGWDGSLAKDGTITVELQAITGSTSELGYTKLGAYTI